MTKRNGKKIETENVFSEEENIKEAKRHINSVLNREIKVIAKNESQKELIKSIKNNEITICTGKAGTGKAQPYRSLVLSKNGFKKISDIILGEEIFTQSGKLTKVVGIFPQGKKDIYKITFSDNSVVECSDDHLWLTWNERERNKWRGPKNNLKKVKNNGTVRTLNEIRKNILVRDNRLNYSIPITNPIDFEKRKLIIHPYLLGILLGDGSFRGGNIKITSSDIEIINTCNKIISEKYIIKKLPLTKYEYSIINKNFDYFDSYKKEIDKLSLLNLKSDNKFIPLDYLYSSIDDRIELLQGLMDSDGTIDKRNGVLSYLTTSKQLYLNFKFLVESLGGVLNPVQEKHKKYKHNGEVKEGKLSYNFSFKIPNNIQPFKLKRKLDYYIPKTKYLPIRFIKNVEYINNEECVCISVEDESKLYITDNFVVTHNTFVSLAFALSLLASQSSKQTKIYLVKSVTTLKGEEVGYLKGNLQEKIEPFIWSFSINMEKMMDEFTIKALFGYNIVKPSPLAYARGTTWDNAIIIGDEMQNISIDNARTLLTRIGKDSKMILLGDTNQVDLRNKEESSLEPLLNMFENVNSIGCIRMNDSDKNVRNPIIDVIDEKFKEYFEQAKKNNSKSMRR